MTFELASEDWRKLWKVRKHVLDIEKGEGWAGLLRMSDELRDLADCMGLPPAATRMPGWT